MKTILVDAVFTFIDEEGNIDAALRLLLDTYDTKKIILTNADYQVDNKYHLNEMPYEVFTLKHNPEKTDAAYFEAMLKHLGLSKGGVVYFEHDQKAVDSAQSVGITSYLYDSEKRDIASLKQFLDANI